MLKISGYKWYGALWACHNPVVITSSSIHIIVGLLPLSAPFTSYMLSFCPDHLADTSSWNASIPWFGGEVLWEQSVWRKGTTQHACPGLDLRFQDSEFAGETLKPPRLTRHRQYLLLVWKYAWIYVRGHYLFRDSNSNLWASTNR